MQVVSFIWRAKYGHFLKAGANRNALTYSIPPKTTVIGLLGAILGLEKTEAQTKLSPLIAISGSPAQKFWHKTILRKDPPVALPYTVTGKMAGMKSPRPEKGTLVNQEWLWKPSFLVSVALPDQEDIFQELEKRLKNQQWHFSPVMGLAFLIAHLDYEGTSRAVPLSEGEYEINSFFPQYLGTLSATNSDSDSVVQLIRMPVGLDSERIFQHENIYLERTGKAISVHTSNAWQVESRKLIFF